MKTELRSFALRYAQKGMAVLPLHSFIDGCCTCGDETCRSPAKHPITLNGVKDATTDPDVINRWMDETEDLANVGIATGNGLLVLDIDVKNAGLESLAALEERFGELPQTPTVQTGGGGKHFYFAYPKGQTIGNKTALVSGIDIRGDGGYVVASPSLHSSGERYRWATDEEAPIAPTPQWLLDGLVNPKLLGDESESPSPSRLSLRVQPPTPDFTSAPGAPEGQRHSRLCQLTGIHLARGEDEDAVEALALTWGERCEPAMDEPEVRKTVRSLACKHASTVTVVSGGDDIDAIPLPQGAPWPVLGEEAYHGLVGDTVRLIAPQTEADPIAILASTLVCVGNSIGRKVWFKVEGDRHHANLFTCLIGDSSRGRKGTSLGRTMMLWSLDDPWRVHCIVNGLNSGEGLKWAVRDKVESIEPVKEKGKVVGYESVIRDHGVEDKRLLVIESEFAQVLRVAKREGNTLSPVVRQAWDTGTLRTLTRNDPVVATDAHISILGHITRQELNKDMSETDCSNGFANRFLWVAVRRSKVLPDGGTEVDLAPMRARLIHALDRIAGGMTRSPAARDLWHQLYPVLTADRPGLWGKVTSRGEAQTLRLSMIYAVLDGKTTIDVPHLRAAYAVWQYAEASARLIFPEEEAMDPLEKALLEKITASPGSNRKRLHKALGGHVPAGAMVEALGRLAVQGKVRSEMIATGGRPGECWWLVLAPPAMPSNIGASTATPVADAAIERTKSEESGEIPALPEVRASGKQSEPSTADQPGDSSFDRGEALTADGQGGADAPSPMTLAELLAKVHEMGGKIVRSADGDFMVQGVEESLLTPDILAALVTQQSELDLIVPASPPSLEVEADPMNAERNEAVQPECLARDPEVRINGRSLEEFIRVLKAV